MAEFVCSMAWLLFAFVHVCFSEALLPKNLKAEDLCKGLFDMQYHNVTSGIFTLLLPESDCRITLMAPPEHRVLMRFVADQYEWQGDQCESYVQIFEGNYSLSEHSAVEEHNVSLCGKVPPDRNFKSQAREILLHFRNEVNLSNEGYMVYFTSFHTGACVSGEFKCQNGFCIDRRLRCNGYNNCGDGSDGYCTPLSPMAMGIAVAAFILTGVGICLYRRYRIQSQYMKDSSTSGVTERETIAMSTPAQPYATV